MEPGSGAPLLREPEIPGLVWGYRFDAAGRATPLNTVEEAGLGQFDAGYIWLHFNLADMRACRWIGALDAVPGFARAFLLGKDTHQQLRVEGEYICGVFADIEVEMEKPTERVGRIVVVLGPRYLISGRRAPLRGVQSARTMIDEGMLVPGSVALLEAIVANASDAMGHSAICLIEEIDAIEDRLLDENIGDERGRLGPIRRTAVRLHRQLLGVLSVLHRIEREGSLAAFPPEFAEAHSRLLQRIEALDHEVVVVQERARLMHDEIDAKLARETNRHLHTLTILTTLFLPPTLLTGMWGMNLKPVPFAENEAGFWWAVLLCIASSTATYLLIRYLGKPRRR
jgi:zinc transporter